MEKNTGMKSGKSQGILSSRKSGNPAWSSYMSMRSTGIKQHEVRSALGNVFSFYQIKLFKFAKLNSGKTQLSVRQMDPIGQIQLIQKYC